MPQLRGNEPILGLNTYGWVTKEILSMVKRAHSL
jgi:hypothetical protein